MVPSESGSDHQARVVESDEVLVDCSRRGRGSWCGLIVERILSRVDVHLLVRRVCGGVLGGEMPFVVSQESSAGSRQKVGSKPDVRSRLQAPWSFEPSCQIPPLVGRREAMS